MLGLAIAAASGLGLTSPGDDGALLFDGDRAMRRRLSETALDALEGIPSPPEGSRFDAEWALVTLQMNVENKFFDADLNAFNIVGEIPGTDKADEIVMIRQLTGDDRAT